VLKESSNLAERTPKMATIKETPKAVKEPTVKKIASEMKDLTVDSAKKPKLAKRKNY
jgi:hypothetical protein